MSKDITTPYAKEQEKKCGRRGYYAWKREKTTIISPMQYGMFIQGKRRNNRT